MKIIVLAIILLLALSAQVFADDALIVTLAIDGDTPPSVKDIIRTNSNIPESTTDSDYHYVLAGNDGSVLASGPFSIDNKMFYDTFVNGRLTGDYVALDNFDITLIVPMINEAETLQLWNRDKLLFEESISKRIKNLPSTTPEDSACVTIQNNGDPSQKLDLIFVGHNYPPAERQRFINEVMETKDFMLSLNPFNNFAERINAHYVDQQNLNLGCYSGCGGIPQLICCSEAQVWAAGRQCPQWTWGTDKIVVLANGLPYGGSSALGANQLVASNALHMKEVAAHEFGHAFGVLGDEYDYGRSGSYGTDVPNCDYAQPCNKWSGVPGTSCVPVCGYNNLFRSITDGLMNSIPNNRYGIVSETNMTWRMSRFNANPRITSTPVTVAYSGQSYTYQIAANDPNNDPLTYSFIRNPVRMIINQYTGLITWNPVVSESRAPVVEIRAQDNRGGYANQSYMIRLL